MTKKIRIANADLSQKTVIVKAQYKVNGEWHDANEPKLQLDPSHQFVEVTIWDTKRYVIEELVKPSILGG